MPTLEARIKTQLGELVFTNLRMAAEIDRLTADNVRLAEEGRAKHGEEAPAKPKG